MVSYTRFDRGFSPNCPWKVMNFVNSLSTTPNTSKDRPLLEARDLVKSYSGRQVVNKVCFHVGHGEIVGLLGRNGAGKTTSFRMTMGIVKPEGGQVLLNGEEISHLPMYRRAQKGVGYLSQENSVFVRLSVEDNLLAILELNRNYTTAQRRQKAHQLMEQFGLLKNAKQEA